MSDQGCRTCPVHDLSFQRLEESQEEAKELLRQVLKTLQEQRILCSRQCAIVEQLQRDLAAEIAAREKLEAKVGEQERRIQGLERREAGYKGYAVGIGVLAAIVTAVFVEFLKKKLLGL